MRVAFAVVFSLLTVSSAGAQELITRQQAIDAATSRGPRVMVGRADSAIARAQLVTARAFPNPSVTAEYTKSAPQRHLSADLTLDFPWLRAARIGAARMAADAGLYRFAFERAGAAFDADVAYTRALAALGHSVLSHRGAVEADTLLRMTVLRRDAGDASELDVQLATVTAGQLANDAQHDSLDAIAAVIDLQVAMGRPADSVTIALADPLALPADSAVPPPGVPLPVAAAEADLAAQERALALERRSLLSAPSLLVGVETGDPSGSEPGTLPMLGVTLPLPILNQNGGPIATARANRDKSQAQLEVTRRENARQIAQARRERAGAIERATRGEQMVRSATQVTTMSRTAYVEGASALPAVLEAQRNAREAQARYIDDMAAANLANAAVHLYGASAQP